MDDGDILPIPGNAREPGEVLSADAGSLQSVHPGKPLFLGVLMLIAGSSSLYVGGIEIVNETLMSHFKIDYYHDVNVAASFMGIFWCISSLIILLTGVYSIGFRNKPERLLSVNEKLRTAWFIALIGLAVGVAGVIADLRAFNNTYISVMLDTYVYIWILPLMLQVHLMIREIKGKKTSPVLWVIMSIINIPLAFSSPWVVEFILYIMR